MFYEMTRVSAKNTHSTVCSSFSGKRREPRFSINLLTSSYRVYPWRVVNNCKIINSFSESDRQENDLDTYSLPGDERGRTIQVPHPSAGSCVSRSASKDSFAEVIEELETTR